MSKGISKQQAKILHVLKEYGKKDVSFPVMSTRRIVMALYPETQAYLNEKRSYRRIVRANFFSPYLHEEYVAHRKRLENLTNYHTRRTSVNRALRNLVKRGLACRHERWGMFQRDGKAGWLHPEYATERNKISPGQMALRRKINSFRR